jgi:SAM-dependent methyltransferase
MPHPPPLPGSPMDRLLQTRRQNLRREVEARGGPSAVAKLLGHSNGTYLPQLIGPNPIRDISEQSARKIEEKLHLPYGSLQSPGITPPPTMPTLYDTIGSTYAHSRRADPGIVQALARQLRLAPGGAYLDLACGTGNYTAALCGLGGQWSAVDVSRVMLDQARPKAGHIAWVQASASALPFPDGRFDGALCTLAIHHFPDLEAPFAEVRRTLRSGPFVIFTGLAEQMHHYWLCHYFPRMMARAIQKMPSETRVRSALHQAGFPGGHGHALRGHRRAAGPVSLRRQAPAPPVPGCPGSGQHQFLCQPGGRCRTAGRSGQADRRPAQRRFRGGPGGLRHTAG